MKTLLVLTGIILMVSPVWAWDYDNSQDGSEEQDSLHYNPYKDEWSYEREDSQLKYNPFDDKWEYTEPDEKLKYNPFEDRWEYAR